MFHNNRGTGGWQVIQFNFGLHDMFPCDQPEWGTCLAVYQRQLLNITTRLLATGSKLQYALTTPYMPLRTVNHTNVEDMNRVARKMMSEHGISIVDLCKLQLLLLLRITRQKSFLPFLTHSVRL